MSETQRPDPQCNSKGFLKEYVRLLHERPVLTKSATSATLGALGSLVSQLLTGKPDSKINWRSVLSYAAVGFVFTGPSVHHFHAWLEENYPKGSNKETLKKLLIDRIVFCPNYLYVYLTLLAVFEGHTMKAAMDNASTAFIPALLVNWKLWTPLQYLNVKYIPQQYRSAVMSIMALLWTIYIAIKRR